MLIRCPRLVEHLSTTMVPSTSNLVVKDVAEDVSLAASLAMVVVVAVLVVRQAVAVHLVVDILARLVDTHLHLGNSLDLVDSHLDLGSSLDTLVVVVVVPGGVALEEVAPPLDRSSASGVARQATSLPIARKLW